MAVFLRGNVWWFEWRTRSERVVKSTGFKKNDRAKAQAVFDAFRFAKGQKPKKSVVEGLLEAIYREGPRPKDEIALSSVWSVYQDWMKGKGKVVSPKEIVVRHGIVDRFVRWATDGGRDCVSDVDVSVARSYVVYLRDSLKLANKTQRRASMVLSAVWEAMGQLMQGVHNPWKAACPDKDGSEVVLNPFSVDEEEAVLKAAKEVGHDWYLASLISRWTGLRYGDVARLDWSQVDLKDRTISVVPAKTRRHKVSALIPIADTLYDALKDVKAREGFVLPEHGLGYGIPPEVPFASVLKRAGISDGPYTFHSWRHTFRTRLAEAGVSDEVARRLGGWTNLKMAAHYDHASHIDEMRNAIGRMSR